MNKTETVKKQNLINTLTWTDLLVLSAWIYGGLLYYVNIAVALVTGSQLLADRVIFAYFVLLIMCSIKYWGNRIKATDVIYLLILVLVVIISCLFNEENRPNILSQLPSLFLSAVPFYALGLFMKQEKRTFDLLAFGSATAVLVNWLYVLVILGTGREMQEDNLFLAYSVLPHTLMVLWYAFDRKRILYIIIAVLGVMFLMSMGSRGPVVSTIVFVMLFMIFNSKGKLIKRFFTVFLPIAIVLVIIISGAWEDILFWLRDLIINMKLSTRVIDAVLYDAGQGSNESRMVIYGIMLENIKQNPFIGYGIFGEWNMIDYSAHQMVLELWCHFGVVIGSILLLGGLFVILKAFRKKINRYSQIFIILMVSFGLVRGIYAGSYLSDYIFLLLGFSVAAVRMKKEDNAENEVIEV
jgi:O-antigen ligase